MLASGLGRSRAAAMTSVIAPAASSVVFLGSVRPVTSRKTPMAAKTTDKTVCTVFRRFSTGSSARFASAKRFTPSVMRQSFGFIFREMISVRARSAFASSS